MTPSTYEHLAMPGLDRDAGVRVLRRLELIEEGARLFAGGLLGVPVETSWSLGFQSGVRWIVSVDGTLSAHVWVDLLSPTDRLDAATPPTPDGLIGAFRCGFLHALGRMLYSPTPLHQGRPPGVTADTPVLAALRRDHPRRRELSASVRESLEGAQTVRMLAGLVEELECARTDGLLRNAFAGAPRELAPRSAARRARARDADPVAGLIGAVARVLAGEEAETVDTAVDGEAREAGADVLGGQLRARLEWVKAAGGAEGAWRLAETVVFDLYPYALRLAAGAELRPDASALVRAAGQDESPRSTPRIRGLERMADVPLGMGERAEAGAAGTVVVALPHAAGGEALFRIDHALARSLVPEAVTSRVLEGAWERYGDPAVAAFAEESAALRHALGVNWERRYRGRYRSGKRVGVTNLRRFVTSDDLRLFQRLQLPDTLSYYFHLLVDTSYSMLDDQNAEKAFAIAYAFTELLHGFRVPVDVTLYSGGVTDLHDHLTDTLEPWFGRSFGYLMSGTLELEAIAYAKQKADRVGARRKIVVVVTDGTPSLIALPHVGAPGLCEYYQDTLIPWLRGAGIELVAMGIGVEPEYHERACTLTEGWDAVSVLIDLLEEIVREGERQERDLWV